MTTVRPIRARISNLASGATRIDVFDDIGDGGWLAEGLTAKSFTNQLSGITGPLEVHINSGGGDVWDGISIKNAIEAHKGPVTTVVDGIAASIASVIAQAGTDRVMMPGSMMMIHDAHTVAAGNAEELTKTATVLNDVSANLSEIYARTAGGTAEDWRAAMKAETWYTAEQAVAAGLATRVGDGGAVLPAGLDLAQFAALPVQIAAQLRELPRADAETFYADEVNAPLSERTALALLNELKSGKYARYRKARNKKKYQDPAADGPDAVRADADTAPQAHVDDADSTGAETNDRVTPPAWLRAQGERVTTMPKPAWLNNAEEAK